MTKDIEIEKQDKEGGGIQIEQAKGEIPPPLQEGEEKERAAPEIGPSKPPIGKGPLQPAVIRLAFRVPGELLALRTHWDGWKLSEEDLQDIVEVYEQLDIQMDVRLQALILPLTVYGERAVGYQIWRRAGRPGLEEKEVGSSHPLEAKTIS